MLNPNDARLKQKAKNMNKQEKNELIDVLNNMLEENKNFYLADISSIAVLEYTG